MYVPSDLWLDQPDAHDKIDERRDAGALSPDEAEALHGFVDDGYIALSLGLDKAFCDALDGEIGALWEQRPADLAVSPPGQGGPTSFRDYEGPVRARGYRIPDLHSHSALARDLYLHPALFRLVDLIFDEPALVPAPARCFRRNMLAAARTDWMEWQAGFSCGAFLMPAGELRVLLADLIGGTPPTGASASNLGEPAETHPKPAEARRLGSIQARTLNLEALCSAKHAAGFLAARSHRELRWLFRSRDRRKPGLNQNTCLQRPFPASNRRRAASMAARFWRAHSPRRLTGSSSEWPSLVSA